MFLRTIPSTKANISNIQQRPTGLIRSIAPTMDKRNTPKGKAFTHTNLSIDIFDRGMMTMMTKTTMTMERKKNVRKKMINSIAWYLNITLETKIDHMTLTIINQVHLLHDTASLQRQHHQQGQRRMLIFEHLFRCLHPMKTLMIYSKSLIDLNWNCNPWILLNFPLSWQCLHTLGWTFEYNKMGTPFFQENVDVDLNLYQRVDHAKEVVEEG